jgi:drug/metabolite transporter (DMT)-like permease
MTSGSFALVFLLEDTGRLLALPLSPALMGLLAFSCAVAVAFNSTNYLLLGAVTPLTYNVIGHAKTILIVLLGYWFFDSKPSARTVLGIAVAMVGVGGYTFEMHRELTSKNDSNSNIVVVNSHGSTTNSAVPSLLLANQKLKN